MTKDNNNNEFDDDSESPRQLARRIRRTAGDRSTNVAHTLMRLDKALLASLVLDDELREVIDKARAVPSHNASRRAERHLAGVLRQVDIDDLERRLSNLQKAGQADARQFQLAESWRTRLIAEGAPAAEAFSAHFIGADQAVLAKLIEKAQREQTTGKPRGATRALFRHLMAQLQETDRPSKRQGSAD